MQQRLSSSHLNKETENVRQQNTKKHKKKTKTVKSRED